LFAWGIHAFAFKQHPDETLWTIWSRWDAASYLHIADGFYTSQGLTKNQHDFLSHFPPFYPLVVRLVKSVSPFSTMMSGLLVSWLAGLAAAYLLAQLAWHEFRDLINRCARMVRPLILQSRTWLSMESR
jgi:Gpi18-like mannosyltransferase